MGAVGLVDHLPAAARLGLVARRCARPRSGPAPGGACASCSGGPRPTTSRTAQPGSVRCSQSAKRQRGASSSMSANTWSMPSPASQRPSAFTPGRVDEEGAAGQHDQLAGGGGVAAAAVGLPDRLGALDVLAGQAVDKVDLPAPEAPMHDERRARAEERCGAGRGPSPVTLLTAHDVGAEGDRLGACDRRVGIGAEVDLGEHDDGQRPRSPRPARARARAGAGSRAC